MTIIDSMGKPCPIPVIEAKKAMAALPAEGGQFIVKVDNQVACQNLEKMAVGSGAACTWKKIGESVYETTIILGQHTTEAPAAEPECHADFVVAVGRDQMGAGSEELGKILLKGFLYSLGELPELPGCLLFFNAGATLTCEGSSSIADLKALEEKGVRILTCGTCADYFGIKEKLLVGEIANMYGISSTMAAATRLINL